MVDGVLIELLPERFGWRFMLGLAAVPSIIMLIGFLFYLPESPRWLAVSNQKDMALTVLKTIRDTDEDAVNELNDILRSVGKNNYDQQISRAITAPAPPAGLGVEQIDQVEINLDHSSNGTSRRRVTHHGMSLEHVSASNEQDDDVRATATSDIVDDMDENYSDDGHENFFIRVSHMLSDVATRNALILGCGLMLIQQFSGVNT